MASKHFALNTEPHSVTVGTTELLFEPEVEGAEFADAYADLKTAQSALTAAGDNVGGEELRAVSTAMREFLASFMLENSRPAFAALKLPNRVLVQMLEYITELYGGGQGNDDTGPSSES